MSLSKVQYALSSDVLIALLLPLFIVIFALKNISTFSLNDFRELLFLSTSEPRRKGYFSLERAHASYSQYTKLSERELNTMRASYAKYGRVGKNLGYKIGYPNKLDRAQEVIQANAHITRGIYDVALSEFPLDKSQGASYNLDSADLGRVRESLKHFVRDWSEDGKVEREKIFEPILTVLKLVKENKRGSMKILVPGCGLGRLAWEISQLGFDTTANELSFFMTLAFRFLLSPQVTPSPNVHKIHPYAHWFSHQRSNESLFRAISFPDVVPRLEQSFKLVEEDFMKLEPMPGGYDYLITLFFIDTSLDFFATLAQIHRLLRPGGRWINLGPLLWTGGGQAKVELSLDEVMAAVKEVGFRLLDGGPEDEEVTKRRTVECEYTGDREAMMRWIYKAEFWVAQKAE